MRCMFLKAAAYLKFLNVYSPAYVCASICLFMHCSLNVFKSEKQFCCICPSLKGTNEHTCVPPGLMECVCVCVCVHWLGPGLSQLSDRKNSKEKHGSSFPRCSPDNNLPFPSLVLVATLLSQPYLGGKNWFMLFTNDLLTGSDERCLH